ncbi:type VII secretion integral membrane protein EccD [uncultured Jatrophihabitans sp.]|uniref:type VII secretion integral membrane protein EccD n=1 Tax=uncultured Jatrophihabitans sp. TaxID=1610747 RepID=UPI0035CA2C24
MTATSPLSGFSRITLSAPTTRADVAVPNSVPVAAILPVLLRHVGQDSAVTVPGRNGWQLLRLDGRALDLAHSMDTNDVRDGDLLILQPADSIVDEPLFDDVVEVISSDAVRERWSLHERRLTAGVLGVAGALVALAALARAPRHGVLVAGICIAAAVLLLLAGLAVSRAAGDLAGGGVVAALAGPFAAVGAPLFVAGPWDRNRLLLACGALLVVAAVLPAVVGGFEAVAGGFAVLAVFGAIGAIITVTGDVSATRAAAVVAPLALALTTTLPALSLRLARLPRPDLASTAAELAELPGEIDQQRTAVRVASARVLLAGLSAGVFGVATVATLVLATSRSMAPQVLAGVLIALIMLRGRLFAARLPVLVSVVAGAAALLGYAAIELLRHDTLPLAVTAAVAGGLGLVALAVGSTAGRWEATPRQRRLLDLLETLLLVAVAPLVLAVWDVYTKIFHLGH